MSARESAEEGLAALEEKDFAAIIADYLLPGMDGLEFFRRIRGRYQSTVRILITAYGGPEIVSEARQIGVDAFIEKPFTVEDLKNALCRLLSRTA